MSVVTALAAVLALLGSGLLVVALSGVTSVSAAVLLLWVASFAQVVLLTELLSETGAIGAAGYLAGHLLLLGAALLLWRKRGRPRLLHLEPASGARAFVRTHPLLCAYAAAAALLALAGLVWPFLYPPVNGDANAYHLPRAYYWLELGTARPFPAVDPRLNEFPPNPSYLVLWVLAFVPGFQGLHLPQWTAGVALAAAVASLARRCGAGREGALFAGATFLTFPLVVLQMGSAQTDLVVAAAAAGAVLFGLRAAEARPVPHASDLAAFGAATGLALGSKLSFGFLLPGLGLGLALLAAAAVPRWPRRCAVLGLSALLGTLLLGAYGFALNAASHGSPFGSKAGRGISVQPPEGAKVPRRALALRYLYQTLDWPGLASSPDAHLPRLSRRAFEAMAGAVGVDLAGTAEFGFVEASRVAPDENRSGFGPAGFAAVAAAPAALLLLLARWRRSRREADLAGSVVVAIGLSWPVVFFALWPFWSPQKIRYFLLAVPLVAAVVLGRLPGSSLPLARGAAALLGALSLATGVAAARDGSDALRRGGLGDPRLEERLREGVVSWLVGEIPRRVAPGSRVGVVSEFNDTVFHLFRALPDLRFVPIAEDEVPAALASGRVAAAVVGQLRDEAGQGVTRPGFLFPRALLLTRDAGERLRTERKAYGLRLGGGADPAALLTRQARFVWASDPLHLRVARAVIEAVGPGGAGARLVIPLADGARAAGGVEATVDGEPADARASERAVTVALPPSGRTPSRVYAEILLRRRDGAGPPPAPRGDLIVVPAGGSGGDRAADVTDATDATLEALFERDRLDLLRGEAPGLSAEGLFPEERWEKGTFRWTAPAARFALTLPPGRPASALALRLLGFRGPTRLRVEANGRLLLDEALPEGALARELALDPPVDGALVLSLASEPFFAGDGRSLGVCVSELAVVAPRSGRGGSR